MSSASMSAKVGCSAREACNDSCVLAHNCFGTTFIFLFVKFIPHSRRALGGSILEKNGQLEGKLVKESSATVRLELKVQKCI